MNIFEEKQRSSRLLKNIIKARAEAEENIIKRRIHLPKDSKQTTAYGINQESLREERTITAANKQLKANLQQIFKSKKGDRGVDVLQQRKAFKIGNSLENNMRHSDHHIRPNQNSRNSSNDNSIPHRTASLRGTSFATAASKDGSHDRLEIQKQKQIRPPLPRKSKQVEQVFNLADSEIFGQNTFKVKVNVEIVAGNTQSTKNVNAKIIRLPPQPPRNSKPEMKQSSSQTNFLPSKIEKSQKEYIFKSLLDDERQEMKQRSTDTDNAFIIRKNNKTTKVIPTHPKACDSSQLKEYKEFEKKIMEEAEFVHREPPRPVAYPNDPLIMHQHFMAPTPYQQSQLPTSRKSTPNLLVSNVHESEYKFLELNSSVHSSLKRRQSVGDFCLSSNSKHQIKWYLSDTVTRVLFEKIYKNKIEKVALDQSAFK